MLLRRCLQKEQQHRFQDIKDARVALEHAGTTPRGGWRRTAATLDSAAAALMLAIVLGSRWLLQKPSAPADRRTRR